MKLLYQYKSKSLKLFGFDYIVHLLALNFNPNCTEGGGGGFEAPLEFF